MSWFANSMVDRQPRSDEIGLIVRPIFSGSDSGILTVRLDSGSLSIGNISGSFTQPQPTTGSLSAIPLSTSTVVIASSSMARMGLMVFNDADAPLYLRLGPGAVPGFFSVRLVGQDYFELPFPVYMGEVTGFWSSGSGQALVTESIP